MTTPTHRPVSRLSTARDAGRNIIIIVGPGELLAFRLKGTRRIYTTTVGACYCLAVKAETRARQAEKAAKRKGKLISRRA